MPPKTILFADDSATMRKIVEKTFALEPFDVITVPSGEAAILKAREIRPSLVIADAGMAGVTGYDVCKAVRQDAALARTPVIVMAGVSSPYDEARGKEVGVTEFMRKPFDTTQLIDKVKALTAGGEVAETAPAPAETARAPAFPAPPSPQATPPAPVLKPVPPVRPIPLAEKPAAAPHAAAPFVAPARPHVGMKETQEFGRPPIKPVPPARPAPSAAKPDDHVEPIEIGPKEEVAEGTFQVGTLAELAQMDSQGRPIAPEKHEQAIHLPAEPRPAPVPATPTPAAVAAKKEIDAVAARVAAAVPGLTAEQAEAIRALTADVVEKVVWEVVPDLAEAIIREEIAKLLAE